MCTHPLRVRLSVMMFLHYFAAGITLPIMSLYLSQELGFGGTGAGLILSFSALAALVAPLLGAFVTDRVISAERLLVVVELAAGLFMFLLWMSDAFAAVLVFYLLYMSMFIPGLALTNAIVFHHSPDGGSSFGGVRLWGTVGWVVAGWLFGVFWIELGGGGVADAPLVTALATVVLGLFSLALPSGSGKTPRRREFIPRAALQVFRRPEVVLVTVVAMLMQLSHRAYYFGAAPYLRHLALPDSAILPLLGLGQITEVLTLLALPFLFRRFSYRIVLLIGTIMELIRFLVLYSGVTPASALLGIVFHGPAYALFFVVSFIYLNTYTDSESRAGVQQFFFILLEGGGALGGNLLAGTVYDLFAVRGVVDYRRFWSVPLTIALVSITLMVLVNVLARRRESSEA